MGRFRTMPGLAEGLDWDKRPMFSRKTKGKEFKMIWSVEKDGRKSFLAGTAHFSPTASWTRSPFIFSRLRP